MTSDGLLGNENGETLVFGHAVITKPILFHLRISLEVRVLGMRWIVLFNELKHLQHRSSYRDNRP